MKTKANILLTLPEEEEIESTAEIRLPVNPYIIRKTIRYRNGIVVVLLQDFQERVFSVSVNSLDTPFRVIDNRVLKIS